MSICASEPIRSRILLDYTKPSQSEHSHFFFNCTKLSLLENFKTVIYLHVLTNIIVVTRAHSSRALTSSRKNV